MFSAPDMRRCHLQKKKLRNYSGFWKGLILELQSDFSVCEKNNLALIFKWVVAWKWSRPRPKFFYEKIYPHHPIYHVPLPKNLKVLIYGAKVIESPEAPEDLHW